MTENIRYLNRINQLSENDMRDFIVLHQILEVEMSKHPKQMDLDLIDECSAQIDELVGEGPKHSSAAIQAKIKEILGTPTSKASDNKQRRPIAAVDTKNRHRVRNFFIILAASLILLYSSLTVAAKVQGYDNAWKFITQKFIEIFNLESGESLEEGSITLVMEDERIVYDSLEILLKNEELNILYPAFLPPDVSLKSVRKYAQENDYYKFVFLFNDENLSIMVKNHYTYETANLINFEQIDLNSYKMYIKHLSNDSYQALCQYNGYEYSITYNNYDELIKIIKSMEEYTS